MTNKSIKLNAAKIISIRKDIDNQKKKLWNFIMAENLMSKKEVKNGYRKHDLKALYNEITQLADKLVYIKGMLAYLNMGYTTFSVEEFKKTNNYNIFMANEAKELISKLIELMNKHTLDHKTKAKKGLKNISKDEVFTSAKITSMIKDLQLKANDYDSNMDDFNNKTDIAIDDSIKSKFEMDVIL